MNNSIYLVDTHVLLWFIEGDSRLPLHIISLIENQNNAIYLSKVSLFEMAVKIGTGKLRLSMSLSEYTDKYILGSQFQILEILPSHLDTMIDLPILHKDPFDRLIVAQAIAESMALISIDEKLKPYPVHLLWNAQD